VLALLAGFMGVASLKAKSSAQGAFALMVCAVFLLIGGTLVFSEITKAREAKEASEREDLRKDKRQQEMRSDPEKFVAEARDLAKSGHLNDALNLLREVQGLVPAHEGIASEIKKVQRRMEQEKAAGDRKTAEGERTAKILTRRAMESLLRDQYLDAGLDIKVDVSGKNADRLTLTYPLFNDVWSHRFGRDGTVDAFCRTGFKTIRMTDNYEWAVRFTCP
jgi:hypothetical protein